ncbi:MAG: hypothetical protein M1832_001627 [Thelocarpon impressellum]|nr:MAG: hypothetical protein M1832_001627 [Thelocarpon impressellum]
MYPQGIGMPSRSSIGSTSTTRPPRQPYAGPSGPQHPYAMYPQNTVPEDAGPSSGAPAATAPATAPATTITLGFPGLGQAYQRRLGPEGEEAADIIGPDGHTEQLPPYTKYPAAVPPKDVAGAASASLSAVPPAVALRGGGLGSPTEPTAESLALRRSRHSTHSMMSDSSRAPLYVDPSAPYRAPSTKEKLVVKGKKRVCWGKVPLWVLLAALIFVLFCAVIIFGVSIPRMIAAREDKQEQDLLDDLDDGQPQPNFGSGVGLPKETRLATLTTTFGAAPLATAPPGTSPIPSGTFSLRLADAVYKSDLCLKDPKQRGAWSCAFPNKKTNMQLQVTEMQDSAPLIQIFAPAQPDGLPKYGAQPPTVGAPTVMGRATDLDDPARGPAFVFQTPYTKIVIVRNNSLGAEAGPDKRAILEAMELHEREEWEALEERDGLDVRDELLSRNWGGDGDGDRGGRGKLRPFRNIPNVKKGDQPWYCYWNNTVLEGFVYLNQDSSAVTQPANDTDDDPASLASNGTVQDAPPEAAPLGAVFPRVFKLEELRVGGSLKTSPPYCVQMQATSDGEVDALLGQDGKPVQVQLDESSTPLVRRRWGFSRRMAQKRQEGTGNCRCRWMAA